MTNSLIKLVASLRPADRDFKIFNEEKVLRKKNKKKLKQISNVLHLSEKQLESAKHPTSITKTCRTIIKLLYPNESTRAEMSISKMSNTQLLAIHGKKYF